MTALAIPEEAWLSPRVALVQTDAFAWLEAAPPASIHAVVTDPPYGLSEYDAQDLSKLRKGRGGVWRIPPTLDGRKRRPVPRFTVLKPAEREALRERFVALGRALERVLLPGGHLMIAGNPLLSSLVFEALGVGGLQKRGEIIRLVSTLRGGDRPKGAHEEFPDVTVMPRSSWEPWGLFRKPFTGTVAQCLRTHGTGALRRTGPDEPFKDVIRSAPTNRKERAIVDHPSLKPQALMRALVRASLPLGEGVVLDPFAGGGSTLAAAEAVGYRAIGLERDPDYAALARKGFAGLVAL